MDQPVLLLLSAVLEPPHWALLTGDARQWQH
jgi:hypothetical protein